MRAFLTTLVVIFVLFNGAYAERFNQFIDWNELTVEEVEKLRRNIRGQGIISDYDLLREAKVLLINGNIEVAKTIIQRVISDEPGLVLTRNRLLALVNFLQNNFERSLELLSQKEFAQEDNYKIICLMKVANLMFLGKAKDLYAEFSRCSNLTIQFSFTDHIWFETLVSVQTKVGIRRSITRFTEPSYYKGFTATLEKTILWLKMVIFLNREQDAYPLLRLLPIEYYKSARFKEVLAFVYYRIGNYSLAEKLVEDLEGPNAENIRGNIRLLEQKYELAYGHFLLALKKKDNSTNAIERILPLAWILGKWDDGIRFLNYLTNEGNNGRNKKIIKAVMLTRKEDYKSAIALIEELFPLEAVGQPLKVNQLISYLGLLNKNETRALSASLRACKQFDGLNCWLLFQIQRWKNFSKVLEDNKKVKEFLPLSIADLKKSAPVSPIAEPVYINQEDIEELDERLVKINLDKK